MPRPITAVMAGAGVRGTFAYSPYALERPDELRFVAVAEPNGVRRERFAQAHAIPPERRFSSWEELVAAGRLADVLFNMTQDRTHYPSTLAALEAGYDVLLEKPMTTRLADTVHLVQTAERSGRLLQVCHVLRYTPFFATLHDILRSGRLGDIVLVEHRENVIYWHMAHSFVRGSWGNTAASSPMILAKCCHDLDILYWNLGRPVERLQSFGSLIHFRPENAPPGATARCTDGCPAGPACPFDARRHYLDPDNNGFSVVALSDDTSMAGRRQALETGPYGRCVYRCDNDAVDHQTVNMEFAGGASVVLFMHGHSHEEGRTMRYDGTRATLRARFVSGDSRIEINDHLTNRREEIAIPPATSGHGGGDRAIVESFVRAARGETEALTSARESLESHLLAFAAEESRLQGVVVDMNDFRRQAEAGLIEQG
ncbi:MAG: Gfo/Idh/MocA family oxidoreductase [Chloroflexi bacterium]|nr:Gfo/Idh/MocA family oxidoreductase [Chloroflexota bacterium]MCI0576261.1 Gfo/Idh/MocA family oxidoreductase [Chloroflexota bacterium]MCI0644543.1 Gfo/Idh/MocA family oxidoreductase [Chloroflexota bacterium]MCI0728768.1 Gfo/Idh/MocA family oxidoreductase [Chloroflexota bacterium]